MKLSIIIPCFNIKDEILNKYNDLKNVLDNIKYELIFIDNGSNDETLDTLKDLYNNDMVHIKIISLLRNYSINEVYKLGIKEAIGEYICLDDGTNAKEIYDMYTYLDDNKNEDVVILTDNNYRSKLIDKLYNWGDKITKQKIERYSKLTRMFRNKVKDSYLEYSKYYSNIKEIFILMGFKTKYLGIDNKTEQIKIKEVINDILLIMKDTNNKGNILIKCLGILLIGGALFYLVWLLVTQNLDGNNLIYVVNFIIDGLLLIALNTIIKNSKLLNNIKKKELVIVKEKIGFLEETIL